MTASKTVLPNYFRLPISPQKKWIYYSVPKLSRRKRYAVASWTKHLYQILNFNSLSKLQTSLVRLAWMLTHCRSLDHKCPFPDGVRIDGITERKTSLTHNLLVKTSWRIKYLLRLPRLRQTVLVGCTYVPTHCVRTQSELIKALTTNWQYANQVAGRICPGA